MEEHCRLISDRDYKEWKECVQKMHILEEDNKQLLKKLDKLKKENWLLKAFLKVLKDFDSLYRYEIKNVVKEIK